MLWYYKLDKLYKSAERIKLKPGSKIVFISDIHRGDGSNADTFLKNQEVYFAALSHYDENRFTYIEIGDGDELWENRKPSGIISAHKDVFWELAKFHKENRFFMLFGNHDIVKSAPDYMLKNYSYFIDSGTKKPVYLFGEMPVYEAIILQHEKYDIFVLHGHQVDPLNSVLWKLARFLVRYVWKPMESFGFKDPTSAAKNYKKKEETEKRLIKWLKSKKLMMIAGHTHRPVFPEPGMPNYFNDGSAVHPRCITAIEIEDDRICLVKWSIKARKDGTLYVGRDVLSGPEQIKKYFWYLK